MSDSKEWRDFVNVTLDDIDNSFSQSLSTGEAVSLLLSKLVEVRINQRVILDQVVQLRLALTDIEPEEIAKEVSDEIKVALIDQVTALKGDTPE